MRLRSQKVYLLTVIPQGLAARQGCESCFEVLYELKFSLLIIIKWIFSLTTCQKWAKVQLVLFFFLILLPPLHLNKMCDVTKGGDIPLVPPPPPPHPPPGQFQSQTFAQVAGRSFRWK